eukprot:12991464-Heterocapsa_arctica.AAC.1
MRVREERQVLLSVLEHLNPSAMEGFPSKRQWSDPDELHQNVSPLLTMISGLSHVKGEPRDEWLSREDIRSRKRPAAAEHHGSSCTSAATPLAAASTETAVHFATHAEDDECTPQ